MSNIESLYKSLTSVDSKLFSSTGSVYQSLSGRKPDHVKTFTEVTYALKEKLKKCDK